MKMASPKSLPFSPAVCGHWTPSVFRHLNSALTLMEFITTLEECLSRSINRKIEFNKIFEPIKPGDVPATYASTDALNHAVGFKPKTKLKDGLQNFTDWYVNYYKKR